MLFTVTSRKFTGQPDHLGWTQVTEFDSKGEDGREDKGRLFSLISIRRGSGSSIASEEFAQKSEVEKLFRGREILMSLHEEYFGGVIAGNLESIRQTTEKVRSEFSDSGHLELGLASLSGNVLYLASSGGVVISLYRGGNLVNILLTQQDETRCASGKILDGDILLLGTETFFGSFPGQDLEASLRRGFDIALEELTAKIAEKNGGSGLGILFVEFSESINDVKELKIERKLPSAGTTQDRRLPKEYREVDAQRNEAQNNFTDNLSSRLRRKKTIILENTDSETAQRKKLSLSVGIVLIAILVVSVVFGINQKKHTDFKKSYQSSLNSANHDVDEAIQIYSIDPSRARELLQNAQTEVLGLETEGIPGDDLDSLKGKIDQVKSEILGVYETDPQLYLDLTLLTSDFSGDLMSTSDGKVYVLDKDLEKIVGIEMASKRSEVVAGPNQLNEPEVLASYADRVFAVNDKGVFEVGEDFDKVVDKDWEGSVLAGSYAGNFYVLQKNSSEIKRYQGTRSGFSAGSDWLRSGVNLNLAGAKSLVIDGTLWVLDDTGEILRFSLGNPINFLVKNVTPAAKPVAIFTGEELKYLYLLDRDNSRVVVVDKEGEYKAQYVSEKIMDAIDLSVSEKEKKILLLTGGKLLSVEIRHLE